MARTRPPADRPAAVERDLPQVRVVPSADLAGSAGADVLAVPVAPPAAGDPEPQPRAGTASAAVEYGVDLATVAENARFTGAAGSVLAVPVVPPVAGPDDAASSQDGSVLPPRLLLVGVGDAGPQALRRAGAALARATTGTERVATTVGARLPAAGVRQLVEGFLLGAWTPTRTGRGEGPPTATGRLDLLGVRAEGAVAEAATAARATWLARDLTATPSSTKTPAWVADQAVALAEAVPGVSVTVLDEHHLAAQGFGGLLAVGRGSATPPRLVTVAWTPPAAPRARHVVLVGKGITFDTGGLSLKPSEAMVPMKTDMAGSAVVLATVLAAARAGVRHRVTAVLALAENSLGADSYRPGDVVTVWGGTTVEISNTDAEGRMVLADALAWADATLDPDVLVDVATLTGAASLGLGRGHAAAYSADDALAAALVAAGAATGERVWRMPLVEDYRAELDSTIADLRHVPAHRTVGGGSITAALFLREFVGRRRWAHLDIAGPARSAKVEHEVSKGATGYGARLLLAWLTGLR